MKTVGNKIRTLRERMKIDIAGAARLARVSRETQRKCEEGVAIKLKSVKQIAQALGASPSDVDDIICSWLRAHAGTDAGRIEIQPSGKSRLRAVGRNVVEKIAEAAAGLTLAEQKEVLLALTRQEVLRSIPHLNQLYQASRR